MSLGYLEAAAGQERRRPRRSEARGIRARQRGSLIACTRRKDAESYGQRSAFSRPTSDTSTGAPLPHNVSAFQNPPNSLVPRPFSNRNGKMSKFEPKQPVNLDPPNYSPMSRDKLADSNGMKPSCREASRALLD